MLQKDSPSSVTLAPIGLLAAVGANSIWGFVPLYYGPFLSHVEPWTTVAYRAVLSLPLLWLASTVIRERVPDRKTPAWVSPVCGLLIGFNWLLFVVLATTGRVIEGSLGYFITPLLMLAAGIVLLGERLTRQQAVAFAVAGVGGVVFAVASYRMGGDGSVAGMMLAMVMAVAVAFYVSIRRKYDVPGMVGLRREITWLVPAALIYLVLAEAPGGEGTPFSLPVSLAFLLGAAVLTVIPLTLFGLATRLLPLRTLGFVHYVGPSLQLLCGWLLLDEVMTPLRWTGLSIIWIALAIYSTGKRAKVQPADLHIDP